MELAVAMRMGTGMTTPTTSVPATTRTMQVTTTSTATATIRITSTATAMGTITATATHMTTIIEAGSAAQSGIGSALGAGALVQLLWLASPALPVGGFSYSEGLEPAIDDGRVRDESSAAEWLRSQFELTQARSELPLLAAAWRSWSCATPEGDARAASLNQWLLTTRETIELRRQTEQMGRSMAQWLRQRHPGEPRVQALAAMAPAPGWPLGFALAAVLAQAPLRETLLAFGFGWCENMVQAALKSASLGQSAGQRLLGALAAALPEAVEQAMRCDEASRQNCSPLLAILSARHETQYSRLFRS